MSVLQTWDKGGVLWPYFCVRKFAMVSIWATWDPGERILSNSRESCWSFGVQLWQRVWRSVDEY